MSATRIESVLRERVRKRAGRVCEYCGLAEDQGFLPFEVDHIIAEKHRGKTILRNLAWSCFDCNRFKGSDIASLDPLTGRLTRIFNPRRHKWNDHFRVAGGEIIPLTAIGRVTVETLKFNLPGRVEVRAILVQAGRYPVDS
ncbi:MAG: HNH endonuclease [Blastocatellia bacterium]